MRFLFLLLPSLLVAQNYDIVLRGGRVMDPESGLDAIRNIGITGKKVAAISTRPLRGKVEIDAAGLVVAPGFIDPHSHGQTPENYRYKAMDGVTTALELEIGVSPDPVARPRFPYALEIRKLPTPKARADALKREFTLSSNRRSMCSSCCTAGARSSAIPIPTCPLWSTVI